MSLKSCCFSKEESAQYAKCRKSEFDFEWIYTNYQALRKMQDSEHSFFAAFIFIKLLCGSAKSSLHCIAADISLVL